MYSCGYPLLALSEQVLSVSGASAGNTAIGHVVKFRYTSRFYATADVNLDTLLGFCKNSCCFAFRMAMAVNEDTVFKLCLPTMLMFD